VPGDPGRLGTPIYIHTEETPRPVEARHTSCTQLLWKPRNPSKESARIYLVTFENSRLVGQGTLNVRSYYGKPAARAGKVYPFTSLHLKPRDPWGQGTIHVRSYCGKTCDPGRQGTPIPVVTAETSQCGQARHTHLRSHRGNLKIVRACVL
jgi:hypothetical protein